MSESNLISSKLAMLYLQNQNLSNKTPEEIFDLYSEAFHKIATRRDEKLKLKKSLKTAKKSQFDL
uniref:Uncharacterized protein n=1 Tax=Siphoviridae sp. ctb3910 TaxID=2827897 RepID=A0A8S5S960_9CAUD|nr:MAG TPA: hypothetical protein [Siphoviridae sp. ctb3910]